MVGDKLIDVINSLTPELSRRRKNLLLLLLVCLVGISIAFAGASVARDPLSEGRLTWLIVTIVIALLALVILSALLFLFDLHRDTRDAPAIFLPVKPLGGEYIIGLSLERGRIVYGAIELVGDVHDPLGRVRVKTVIQAKCVPWSDAREVYSQAGLAIAQLVRDSGNRIVDGIGIAIPGAVDIRLGELQRSPAGLNPGNVASEVGKVLAQHDLPITDKNLVNVRVDNDARCMGRYLLHEHYNSVSDFVMLYVGQGVGSAIVLNRDLYFGKHGFAGECGHHVFSPDRRITLSWLTEAPQSVSFYEIPQCKCGRAGTHYETVIAEQSLLRLAAAIDEPFFKDLKKYLAGPSKGVSLLSFADDVLTDANTESVELCKRLANGNHRRVLRFFVNLSNAYIDLLSVGIANVVNTLDVDTVFLCGPLMEHLDRLPSFRQRIRDRLRQYTFRDDPVSIRVETRVANWAWMGAALLFRDSAYAQMVNG